MNFGIVPIVSNLNFRFSVAVNTPPHGQWGILVHNLHFLDWPMTSLTLYLTRCDMLGMVKIGKVR